MSRRDISPLLQAMRNVLLGRKHKTALRFQDDLAPRTADPPHLPEGPHAKLSANYYYSRDARREVVPPLLLVTSTNQKLGSGASEVATQSGPRTPGNVYQWD